MSALAESADIELLTADDVAAALKVSTWTVFNETQAGRLASVRIGRCVRFTRDDVARFIDSQRTSNEPKPDAPRVVRLERPSRRTT